MIKSSPIKSLYMIMDEMYTFIHKKRKRFYVWTAITVTQSNRKFFYYYFSHNKSSGALFHFKEEFPNVDKIYTDGNYSYNMFFGNIATMEKSKITNIIENLNSQIRDKISYLVRRTKAHSKNFEWLDNRLAWFFVNKNLQG